MLNCNSWNHLTLCQQMKGCSRDVMGKAMDCGIVVCEFVSSRTITFTFGKIPLGKV